jgi:RNA polymerase sigma factor (sigma-70 family)
MSFLQNSPYVDTLVLNALRNDDEAALNYLFTTYYNKLFRTGLKLGASSQTTEEAIQSVFVDIWQYRKTLGEVQSFEAYLKGSLRKRLAKMAVAQNKQADHTPSVSLSNTPISGDENAAELLLSVEAYEQLLIEQETNDTKRQQLTAALEQLTPRQKELVVLRYFEEMNYNDMAQKTGLQVDSIYKTIHEALKRLRSILEK